jgi:glutathione S-transferase
MYTLYTIPGSCSTGIHALLIELGQPYEIVMRSDVPDYKNLVATNQVPALQTEDGLITEGAAICHYLLKKHADGQYLNSHRFVEALMYNYATLHGAYSKLFATQKMPDGQEKQAYQEQLAASTTELWQIVNQRLEGKTFMHENTPTVIDYLLAIYVRWGNAFPNLNMPVGANVLALVEKVSELPQFQQAFEKEDTAYTVPVNALAA